MHDEGAARTALQDGLGQLSGLLKRTSDANGRYDAVMSRYLRPDKPMWRPWGTKRVLIGIVAAIIVIGLNTVSIDLFMYAALATALALAVGGVFLLVRGGPARHHAIFVLGNSAIIVFLIFVAGRVVGLRLSAWLLAAALVAAVLLAVAVRDAYLPVANQRIIERNQGARESAFSEASSELAPIEKEVADIQRSYRAGGYRKWFPEKYLDIASVNALWHIVHDARADTLKEAINLYLQDLHNQYMRDAADQQAAIAQMQLAEQQRTTRAVQIGSVMNVGMQAFQGSLIRSTMQAEGAATRAAINAPKTIRFK